MKRRGMLILAVMTMLMNTLVFIYLDKILKQEMSVYIIQVGRYEKQENADSAIKQLNDLGYEGYSYKNKDIIVLAKIVFKQSEANQLAKELSQKGMTCVVKEYLIDGRYKEEINNQNYTNVYKELK